jgi:hypothetical protein
MRKPSSFSATLIAAALFSVSAILMSARGDPGPSGGGDTVFAPAQIAAGDKKAIGRFFAANQIEYDLDNFMQIAFHGQATFGESLSPPSPPTQTSFAFLASCINAHTGHLFIIDEGGRIVLSQKTGCQRSVEVKEVNGFGRNVLISTDSGGGTGFGSVWKCYYFFDGEHFHKGLEYEGSSYEAVEGSYIFPGATDWRRDVWALKETEGEIRFLENDQDGIREWAEVKYTTRHVIQGYDRRKDPDGSVLARVGGVVNEMFGEVLNAEKTRVEIWNWKPASFQYQVQQDQSGSAAYQ